MSLFVAVPVATAAIGWTAATLIHQPEDVLREAPTPSLVTTEAEMTVLESAVTVRGDVLQAEEASVALSGEVGGLEGQPVITGGLPAVGDELDEGGVLAGISGRPVLLIEGDLPVYRSLGPGSSGADVKQLERALARLGHFPGEPDEDYNDTTQEAVEALYAAARYEPPEPSPEAEAEIDAAETALEDAERQRDEAASPPPESQVLAAEAQVAAAESALADAEESGDADAIEQAGYQVAIAEAALEELTAEPDLAAFDQTVEEARERLAELRASAEGVPRGELYSLPTLPRRVSAVTVGVGDAPGPAALTLSGVSAQVVANVPVADAELISAGDTAEMVEASYSIDAVGTVTEIRDAEQGAALQQVVIEPDEASAPSLEENTGVNLLVRIPVAATDGEVLAVSLAAVYTAADGRTYVRVARGGEPGDEETEEVEVTLGLAAEGMVEIVESEGLQPGDPVVVSEE